MMVAPVVPAESSTAHWFALDPGNPEDNYTYGNTEWIFGNGDEETRADFQERSNADPHGPVYGQYIGAEKPQIMTVPRPTHQPVRTEHDRALIAILASVGDAEDAQDLLGGDRLSRLLECVSRCGRSRTYARVILHLQESGDAAHH